MGSGFRTFQSGEVLTSSNVQNYLMDQSVMVFAGTAARSSAIGSAETGMLTYRTDGTADAARQGFEFWSGSAWTRLVQPIGVELVTTVTVSATSTININNCFSSTYTNYLVVGNLSTNANSPIKMRMRASGTDATGATSYSTGLEFQALYFTNNGYQTAFATDAFNLHVSNLNRFCGLDMVFYQPFEAASTKLMFRNCMFDAGTADPYLFDGGGLHNVAASYDGFSFYTGTAQTLTGSMSIYGYVK